MIREASPLAARQVLAERYVDDRAGETWRRILADLHPKQRAFVLDRSPRKCALKGRRGGGSYGTAAWLIEDFQKFPGALSLFLAHTKEAAKAILWPTLEDLNERYDLGIVFNGLELSATFPNGYKVLLKGAKDKAQVEKLRGHAKGCRRIAIDEAGSFEAHDDLFRYLIRSVLVPQLMDQMARGGGQLALIGSPGQSPVGFYFETTTGHDHMGRPVKQWPTHHWTALDNPYVQAREFLLEELESGSHILDDTPPEEVVSVLLALKDVPANDNDPRWPWLNSRLSTAFRREYLAQWVKDYSRLIYLTRKENLLPADHKLPAGQYRICVGCDIGWGDGNGFAVAAKEMHGKEVFLLEAYYLAEMGTGEIALELQRLATKYHTGEIYVDTGGEGRRLLVDLEHFGVYAQPAGKGRKKVRIEYMRSLLESKVLKVRPGPCAHLLTEWSALPWSDDRQTHREGYVDDVSDAALMAVMPLSQLFVPAPPPKPKLGSAEWRAAQDRREHELAVRKGKRLKRREKRRAA